MVFLELYLVDIVGFETDLTTKCYKAARTPKFDNHHFCGFETDVYNFDFPS